MTRKILIGFGLVYLVIAIMAQLDLYRQKPRLPVLLNSESNKLLVVGDDPEKPDAYNDLKPGDRILEVDGRKIPDEFYLNFLLDGKAVGDVLSLVVERDGRPINAKAQLVRSISTPLIIINFIVATLVWAIAMLVLFMSPSFRVSFVFHLMAMALSVVMFVYWPENSLAIKGGHWISLVLSNGFYPMTVAFLFHFSLFYPEGYRRPWLRWLVPFLYLPALGVAVALIVLLPEARQSLSVEYVHAYGFVLTRLLPLELAVYFIAGLITLGISYANTTMASSRQRLKWLFLGFFIGISPHVILYEFPKTFGWASLTPEWMGYVFAAFAPIAFFISVVRYQMFDVNLVIRRSIVYSMLTALVIGVYLLMVAFGDWLATEEWGRSAMWIRIVTVLVLAAVFEPARNTFQGFMDKIFYKTHRDQRHALMDFSRDAARTLDIYQLTRKLEDLLNEVIPLTSISIFMVESDSLVEIVPNDPGVESRAPACLSLKDVKRMLGKNDSGTFEMVPNSREMAWVDLLIPLMVEDRLIGMIALGGKRAGDRFMPDEKHFVKALAAQTALAFDRARAFKAIQDMNIGLEQEVFKRTKQLAEANDRLAEQFSKLQKLNDMKEALTRMVVHDLKNPVSTILLGLEFLDRSELGELPSSVTSTLDIISSTAQEIQDLIANLLDVYRMEAGELNLSLRPVELRGLFDEASQRIKVLAQYRRVSLDKDVDDSLAPELDRDLLIRVLVNLLTNAVKHSHRDASVLMQARCLPSEDGRETLEISVKNSGSIIPEGLHEKIFEKFFQVEGKKKGIIAGTGLGLAFCKLVVEAHSGRIWVESPAPGMSDGARFVISIPIDKQVQTEAVDPDAKPEPVADESERVLNEA